MISNINHFETVLSKILNVKPWAKKIELFLGEKRKLFYHLWTNRGLGEKREVIFGRKKLHPIQ